VGRLRFFDHMGSVSAIESQNLNRIHSQFADMVTGFLFSFWIRFPIEFLDQISYRVFRAATFFSLLSSIDSEFQFVRIFCLSLEIILDLHRHFGILLSEHTRIVSISIYQSLRRSDREVIRYRFPASSGVEKTLNWYHVNFCVIIIVSRGLWYWSGKKTP